MVGQVFRLFLVLSQIAVDTSLGKLVVSHEFTNQRAIFSLLLEFQDFSFIELFAPAKLDAVGLGFENAFHLAFGPNFGFKLGNGAQDMKDEPPRGVRGINTLIQHPERHVLFLQRVGNLAEMHGGTRQAVQASNHQNIVLPHVSQAFRQFGTLQGSATALFLEDVVVHSQEG